MLCWVSNAVQGCTEPRVSLFCAHIPYPAPLFAYGAMQSAEDPDMLTLVPLPAAGQGTELEGAGRQVPWFGAVKGFCLVSAGWAGSGCIWSQARACKLLQPAAQPLSSRKPMGAACREQCPPAFAPQRFTSAADASRGCCRGALPHDPH